MKLLPLKYDFGVGLSRGQGAELLSFSKIGGMHKRKLVILCKMSLAPCK